MTDQPKPETPKPLTAAQHVCQLVVMLVEYMRRLRFEDANHFTAHVLEYLGREDLKPILSLGLTDNILAGMPGVNDALREAGFRDVHFRGMTEFIREGEIFVDDETGKIIPRELLTDCVRFPAELTPAMKEVLGLPNFMCAPFAARLRAGGHPIPRKAEEEQAAAIWWLLPFAVKHGAEWRYHAVKNIPRPKWPVDAVD